MDCIIGGKIVNATVIENLGSQGGRYAKVVKFEGEEHVVVRHGQIWKQHVPSILPNGSIVGQKA